MTELNRAGQDASLGHIDTTQREFRQQIDVVADELRQLAGNPDISTTGDALNAPYVLYVNSYTGSDVYVGGDYRDTGDVEARISLQRLEAGYSEARPFRTINRAVIEAGIITSRSYFTTDAERGRALVSIVVAPGEINVLNGEGSNDAMTEWADGTEPTEAQLTAFNPTEGGVILPRGCSLVSMDLRKTIFRPTFVPTPADEEADYSNRSAIFRMTGAGYYYGFTFADQAGSTTSHHLLSCFEYASEAQLTNFYRKIREIAGADVNATNGIPQEREFQIVGPQPDVPTQPTDTVNSASPYIYNISIRSILGLGGIFANGAVVDGFRSVVIAQYTGVSLQTDLNNWQVYNAGTWQTPASYNALIAADPDDLRAVPERRSFHIRAVNNAVIQEVSVFAIGQSIHHWTESGGELTITNSNSNFGGCAALSQGFKDTPAPRDEGWSGTQIRRALNPFDIAGNVRIINIGRLVANQDNTATTLELDGDFNPSILEQDGYNLKDNDYIWVDNPGGANYRARLAATPWDAANPNLIQIRTQVETDDTDGNVNPSDAGVDNNQYQPIAGNRVYVRRFLDVRSVAERRYGVILQGNGSQRKPIKEYVMQPETGSWNDRIITVNAAETVPEVNNGYLVEMKTAEVPEAENVFDTAVYYRPGDTVRRNNKHITCISDAFGAFDADQWTESYVHMEEEYVAPDYFKNVQPLIIFDGDTDQAENSATMGFALNTAIVQAQYESGTDYRGVYNYLRNLGRSQAQARSLLVPQAEDDRDIAVASDVEFRRPSIIRTFGQAYEWAGFGNYTKALPQYQGDLGDLNKFTYYFTNQNGGKVFASGFNEEGFLITNRGIEDVESGKTLGFEAIGDSDVQIDIPELPIATQTDPGIVELATTAEVDAGEDATRAVTPESLQNFRREVQNPTGTVLMFAGAQPPTGYLECDGAEIPAQYEALRALVGTNTPDLRGEFVRGWDHGRGIDDQRAIRSTQDGQLGSHDHTLTGGGASGTFVSNVSLSVPTRVVPNTPDEVAVADDSTSLSVTTANVGYTQPTVDATGGTENTNEVRPRNVALMYIIKHD